MALLTKNSTPAERDSGCFFSEKFESTALVEENGGVLVGSPPVDNGIQVSNGKTVLYNSESGAFQGSGFSVVIEFMPTFEYDLNKSLYLFGADDGAGAGRYYIYKAPNSSSNVISVRLGETFIANITSAAYKDYWLKDQRNIMVLTSESGDTDVWLNGTQILTGDASVWSNTNNVVNVGIGCRHDRAGYFEGTIFRAQLYNKKLSDFDAASICAGGVYDYAKDVVAAYEMLDADHDLANTRTLDKTANANHLGYINNVTKMTSQRGYTFDGVNDRFEEDISELTPSGDFTVAIAFRLADLSGYQYLANKWKVAGDLRGWCIRTNGTTLQFGVSEDGTAAGQTIISAASGIQAGCDAVLVCRYKYVASGTSILCICVDGQSTANVTNAKGPVFEPSLDFRIGTDGSLGNDFEGRVYCMYFWDSMLSDIQVKDLTLRIKKQLNSN